MSDGSRHASHRLHPAGVWAPWGCTLEATVEETPDHVRINLSGDGADVLLRRKGEALDALQVIVNTAFRRDARGDRHYVDRRAGLPQRQGRGAAADGAVPDRRRPRRTGVPQEIGPLNPYARRIVHLDGGRGREPCRPRASATRSSRPSSFRARTDSCRRPRLESVPCSHDDTIVAIATPPGRGGIGVVRLSGPAALEIAVTTDWSRHCRSAARTRRSATRARSRRTHAADHRPGRRRPGLPRRIRTPAKTWWRSARHGSPVAAAGASSSWRWTKAHDWPSLASSRSGPT